MIQCVGDARVDEQAIAMGGPGGRVVLIGAALEPFSVRAAEIFWRELSVLGSRGFIPARHRRTPSTCTSTARSTCATSWRPIRPLDEAAEALADLRAGRVFRSVLLP